MDRNNKGQFIKGSNPRENPNWIKSKKKYWKNYKLKRIIKICQICEKEFKVYPYRKDTALFCSGSCRGKYVGNIRTQNIKPRLSTQGYWFIKFPNYHRANKQGYAKMCDIVAEEKIGRQLKKNEVVHHIDKIRTNDHPDNLQVLDKREHDRLTAIDNKNLFLKNSRKAPNHLKHLKNKNIC